MRVGPRVPHGSVIFGQHSTAAIILGPSLIVDGWSADAADADWVPIRMVAVTATEPRLEKNRPRNDMGMASGKPIRKKPRREPTDITIR